MIFPLFRRDTDTISALYGMIVAQARMPVFYRVYGVPDTLDGRFELILLHLFLLLRRLDRDPQGRDTGQQVFDLFCQDMDQNLREMGVGDLKVPKEMRRMGEAYYGRAKAYEAALTSGDSADLRTVVARNVFGTEKVEQGGDVAISAYMADAASQLAEQDIATLNRGLVQFPDLG